MNPQQKVTKFLASFQSHNTVKNYRIALAQYFQNIYGGKQEDLDAAASRYFSENRDYEADVENFVNSKSSMAPKTVKLRTSAIKTFLIENDVELSTKFWRRLSRKVKGSRALTLDKVPSNTELRKILMHMPIHGKALCLTLASSGMRIGEALQLRMDDVKLSEHPPTINIRGEYTKTGNSRFAFISGEAKEVIDEWLKTRDAYLSAAAAKSHTYAKSTEDQRLFPFKCTTAYFIWQHALEHAQKDERDLSTNRHRIHPHVLRKFFRTKMATLIPVDVTEALMGHEGYLTEVYRRYSQEDLAKFYLQGEAALLVFTDAEQVTQLRVEVEERNKQLQTLANGLAGENLDLKARVAKVEAENVELRKRQISVEEKLGEIEKTIRETLKAL